MRNSILLFGGSSDERLVSVASAQNVAHQYKFSELWFLHPEGPLSRVAPGELAEHTNPFEQPFRPEQPAFASSIQDATSILRDKTVFLGLHGTEGEDGTLQACLENARIPFTGSDSASSRLCFEKDKAKEVVSRAGVTVAPQIIFTRQEAQTQPQKLQDFFVQNGPTVLKPIASGSSFGLCVITDASSLQTALQQAKTDNYDVYLVEKFIQGRELTIGVIADQNQKCQALPASEVVLQAGHSFDYQGKYLGRGTVELTPAQLTADELQAAQKMALQAHQALRCYGYSRTDIILSSQGPVFLETNTLPGLSKASFIPQQLKAAGISVQDFIEGQLRLAEKRNAN